MNIETFFEARDLYDKYQLCEKVMEYLSDEESVKGQKYLETLKQFADAFKMEFMTFVHERMESVGMQFEDCGKCTCENCPADEEPTPPTEEKEPKFPIGSKVEVIEGIGKGGIGVVKDYNPTEDRYYVVSDNFYMWFAEADLKAYEDESEMPPFPSDAPFGPNDKVKVIGGEYDGMIGVVGGYNSDLDLVEIELVVDGDRLWLAYPPEELEPYTDPETPEENGGTDTPDEGE